MIFQKKVLVNSMADDVLALWLVRSSAAMVQIFWEEKLRNRALVTPTIVLVMKDHSTKSFQQYYMD